MPQNDKADNKIETKPKMRQIVIETDGNNINLVKAEVGGRIELVGILQGLIGYLNQKSNDNQVSPGENK